MITDRKTGKGKVRNMSQTYQARRRAQDAPAEQKSQASVPGPSIQELAAGAMPSTAQMGHRVDLPGAIREKMEASFGADFSGVKLYESQTVADAGAQAMTMGSSVAFAPGQLDLSSTSGQALLGHELSHVVSQARGESAGRGFLADSGLESQADRQGAMAARGESIYSGPVSPLSASAVSASAAGPMQASKAEDKEREQAHDSTAMARAERKKNRKAYDAALARYKKSSGTFKPTAYSNFVDDYLKESMAGLDRKAQDQLMKAMMENDQDTINNHLLERFRAESADKEFQYEMDEHFEDGQFWSNDLKAYGRNRQRVMQRRALAKAMKWSGKGKDWVRDGELTDEEFKNFYRQTFMEQAGIHDAHKTLRKIKNPDRYYDTDFL